jgi:multidrug resistance protein, MATE family
LLTLPISLSRLIPEFNFLVNSIFLGHLGEKQLAYAAITGVYYLIFSAVSYGLSNAILSVISREAGANNREAIINTLRHGVIIAAIWFVIGLFTTYFLLEPILLLSGIKPDDIKEVMQYMYIRIFGLIFICLYQLCNAYLICIQETKWLLIGSLVSAITNIVFDYWFIFGGWGFNGMGFNGAAYASVLAEFLGLATVYVVIISKKFSLKYDIPDVWNYSPRLLKNMIIQASPLMAQYAISIIAWFLFYLLINKYYSYTEQAVSQTMRSLFGMSGVFSWAFGSTTNTMISNLIGQGKHAEVRPTIHKILLISVSGIIFFIILINISPMLIFKIFGQGENFAVLGTEVLRVISLAMFILTISVIWLNSVVATGNTKFVFLTEFVSIVFYLVYVWYISAIYKGTLAHMWMSEWLYWTVMLTLSYGFMNRYLKIHNKNLTH